MCLMSIVIRIKFNQVHKDILLFVFFHFQKKPNHTVLIKHMVKISSIIFVVFNYVVLSRILGLSPS